MQRELQRQRGEQRAPDADRSRAPAARRRAPPAAASRGGAGTTARRTLAPDVALRQQRRRGRDVGELLAFGLRWYLSAGSSRRAWYPSSSSPTAPVGTCNGSWTTKFRGWVVQHDAAPVGVPLDRGVRRDWGLSCRRRRAPRRRTARSSAGAPRGGRPCGSQPRISLASVMSGWRTCGSSVGSASNTISEREPVTSITALASSSSVNSFGLPMLTGLW